MLRSRYVFPVLFALVCLFVFAYPVMRLSAWAGPQFDIGWSGAILLWLTGFFGMWYSFSGARMLVRYFVVHWMGVSFIFATTVVGYEVLRVFGSFDDQEASLWVAGTACLLVLVAWATSHHLNVRRLEIRSPKLSEPRRVVQISDVHIGSRQRGFMDRIVNRINRLEPDFVVITGDLIDSSAVEIDALRPLENLSARTFFSIGNHERYADLPKALSMVETLGVIPLRQQSQVEHEIQFIGIDDADHREQVANHLPSVGVNDHHFSILLYHRPMGWEDAVDHGIDLMLSGHTHNGQIFPFNLLVRQQFKRIRGLYREADCHLYVSSGTGTWGPLMRLGSLNEISCFDLIPHK